MKRMLLLICLLFSMLLPIEQREEISGVVVSPETYCPIAAAQTSPDEKITATTTFDTPHRDSVTCNGDPLPTSQRHLTSRKHPRFPSHFPTARNLLKVQSHYLTTLIQHISQTYTTVKIQSRQYPVDNYVYAYRHILI